MAESGNSKQDVADDQKEKSSLDELSPEELKLRIKKYLFYLKEAKRKCQDLNEKCATLEQERDAANEVISKWQSENKTEQIAELQYRIRELKKEIDHLTSGKSSADEELVVLITARDTAMEALKKMKNELSASRVKNEEYVSEIEQLTKSEMELRSQLEMKNEVELEKIEEIKNLIDKYNDLSEKHEGIQSTFATLKSQFEYLMKEKDEIRAENQDLLEIKSQYVEVQKSENIAKCENITLKQNIEEVNILNSSLSENCAKLTEENKILKEQIENLQFNNEELVHIVEEYLCKVTKKDSSICKENSNIAKEFNAIAEKYEEQNSLIISVQDALFKLSCFGDDTETSRLNLLEMSEIICHQFKDLTSNLTELENKNLNMQTMEHEANSKIEALETDIKTLRQKLELELTKNNSVIEKLEKDYENLERSCKSLEEERDKLIAENTDIKGQCNDMLREISVASNAPMPLLQLPYFEEEEIHQALDVSEIKRRICDCYSELKIKLDTFENEKHNENFSGNKKIKELENEVTNLSSKLEESYNKSITLIKELDICKCDKELIAKGNVELSEKYKDLSDLNEKYLQEMDDIKLFLSQHSCLRGNEEMNTMQLKEMCRFMCKYDEELETKFNELEKICNDEKTELNHKLNELQLKLDFCSQENESLKTDLEHYKACETEKIQLTSEISSLRENDEKLKQQNNIIETVRNILLDLLNVCNKDNEFSNLSDMCQFIFDEHVRLKENLNTMEEAKLDSEKKLNGLLLQISSVNEENQSLVTKLGDYNNIEKNLLELTSEKALMTEKFEEMLHITETLKDEMVCKEQHIVELNRKITDLQYKEELVDVYVQATALLCDMSVNTDYLVSEASSQIGNHENSENEAHSSLYGFSEWGFSNDIINAPITNMVSNDSDPEKTSVKINSSSTSSQTEEKCLKNVYTTSSQTDSHEIHEISPKRIVMHDFGISEWGCIDGGTSNNGTTYASGHDANSEEILTKADSEIKRCNLEIQTDDFVATEIENLLKENKDLKLQFETKTKLVGDIQNLLNSRLEKEEEINAEMDVIKSDFERANQRNELLEQEKIQLLEANESLKKDLTTLKKLSIDLRLTNNNIETDFNNFRSDFIAILSDTSHCLLSKCDMCDNIIANLKNETQHYKTCFEDITRDISNIAELFLQENLVNFFNIESIRNNAEEIISHLESKHLMFEIVPFNKFRECVQSQTKEIKLSIEQVFSYISKLIALKEEQENECNELRKSIIPSLEQKIQEMERISETSRSQKLSEDIKVQNSNYESLQDKIVETETKMNKFKAVALRLKKELSECQNKYQDCVLEKEKYKKQVGDISEELDSMSTTHSKYVLNFQNLQCENDKLQDKCEDLKSTIKTLQTNLSNVQADFDKCKANLESVENNLQKANDQNSSTEIQRKDVETKFSSLEGKIIVLETRIAEDQNKIKDLLLELTKSRSEITDLMKEKESLLQKLNDALKEGKQHNLIDLEMADYQRSIEELTSQLEKKNMHHEDLRSDNETLRARIDTLQAEIKICENHKDIEEKRAEGFKEALENTKKELMLLREAETELRNNFVQTNLKLEILGQKEEQYKAEISNQTAEVERLKDMMGNSVKNHDRIVRSLKTKISSQEQNILVAHKEVESVKQDFENYKIRVHSVLKQQKNVANVTPSDEEERQNLETQVEKLKLQIKEISDKLLAITLEKETLQEEYNHLLQRNDKIAEEFITKDKNWNAKFEQANLEKSRLQLLLQDVAAEHATKNEIIAATYKKQIKNIQEEHKIALKNLQTQLEAADIKIANLEREQQRNGNFIQPTMNQEEPFSFDILSQERQEGEGSECNENISIKPLSLATIPSSGFIPLDRLLQSPVESEKSFSFASLPDPEKLSIELAASVKKLDHLRELLNESEANNMRFCEQVRLLKEEVRRLERNKQRTEHEENLEYLKNVFVKFATLDPGSERSRLVPVLTTMLKLSPDEQQKLKNVAGDNGESESSSTWSSYLHRWSGT